MHAATFGHRISSGTCVVDLFAAFSSTDIRSANRAGSPSLTVAIAAGQRPANSERPPDIRGEDPSAAGCGPQGDHAEGLVAAGHDHQVNGAVHGAEDLVAERAGKGATLDAFLLRERRLHWDGIPVPGVNVADLNPTAFKYFRNAAAGSGCMAEAVLQDGNETIIDNVQLRQGEFLRQAAVLIFHETPERFVPGAYIKIGFFRSDADLAYQT